MLAVAWAANKCKTFLMGLQNFQVITDHNPLIPIQNNHHLDEIGNPRLQQLKTKLLAFNLTTKLCKDLTQVPATQRSTRQDAVMENDHMSQSCLVPVLILRTQV